MKKIFLIILCFFVCKGIVYGDSLKVHVVGLFFKKETFKFYYGNYTFIKKIKYPGANAFAFFIDLPDTIKHGDLIHLGILRKGKFANKFKSIKLDCYYDTSRKYFVLVRDFRLKDKYALRELWVDRQLYTSSVSTKFWTDSYIPPENEVDTIEVREIKK